VYVEMPGYSCATNSLSDQDMMVASTRSAAIASAHDLGTDAVAGQDDQIHARLLGLDDANGRAGEK
jgi:hypothetical protein